MIENNHIIWWHFIMIVKKLKRLYARRKAISPVVAALLLIALTVAAVAIVFFVVIPAFRTYRLEANIVKIYDTNKDSQYNRIELQLANTGTQTLNITSVTVWTALQDEIANSDLWLEHPDWYFDNPTQSRLTPSEIVSVFIEGDNQIGLSIYENTWYRLEITYSGATQAYLTEWASLTDKVDLSDLLVGFDTFNLTAAGFSGTVDDLQNPENNYFTDDSGDYQLSNETLNYLPVLDEEQLIPFRVTNSIVIFPSTNADFQRDAQQKLDFSSSPFRAKKFFILGLAGSWGDEFSSNDWALNLTFQYTDNTYESFLLNKSYIDDWYYGSNPGGVCISVPDGLITEIDLGRQIESGGPGARIHTHTTRFYFDYYKYVKSIIFTDPNDDQSGPHLLSLTLG